jgi:hypothetical protein
LVLLAERISSVWQRQAQTGGKGNDRFKGSLTRFIARVNWRKNSAGKLILFGLSTPNRDRYLLSYYAALNIVYIDLYRQHPKMDARLSVCDPIISILGDSGPAAFR